MNNRNALLSLTLLAVSALSNLQAQTSPVRITADLTETSRRVQADRFFHRDIYTLSHH